jgi:RNA polymerase sigma-70 factor (ECF subfamily)
LGEKAEDFAELYEEHVWTVYGFIGYRVKTPEQAEDLTQQTFERALKAWRRFDPERSKPSTWLLAIARNLLIDHYRHQQVHKEAPLEGSELETLEGAPAAPDRPNLGLAPDLERALAALADRDREVIALRFGGDLNGPEIAEITGLSLANVQQILSRSLRRMRDELGGAAESQASG